jgi:2-oxoglutarate dehydrogenase E2 component (dihydrolipoamide succinyltransferase)
MPIDIPIPSPGESVTEVTLAAWLKNDGDYVEKDEPLFEIESDKATLSVFAEAAGTLHVKVPQGENVKVGTVAATIDESAVGALPAVPVSATRPPTDSSKLVLRPGVEPAHKEPIPSVAARKILEERDVSLRDVPGTGRGGRITKDDALKFQPQSAPPPLQTPVEALPAVPVSSPPSAPRVEPPRLLPTRERNIRRQKLSALRLKAAERLVAAKNQTAMLTTFNEIDMSNVMALRAKFKERFKEKYDVNLGFMSFFVKAVAGAIEKFPAVNAMIDGSEIVYHDFVDMGIAVQAPKGLVVPVLRNAESLMFGQIELEIDRLANRARNNQLTIDEMTGGTFTISNGGVFGSLMSTPILNPPQSAILGMHNIVKRPVAVNDQVEIRPMMYVALSYDHRIIDGRESVSFLVRIKELVEDPMRLMLKV